MFLGPLWERLMENPSGIATGMSAYMAVLRYAMVGMAAVLRKRQSTLDGDPVTV